MNVMQNTTATSICTKYDVEVALEYHYWIKGVLLSVVAIIGIILNVIAMHILATRNSMKNTFNSLLISLFCIDSLYLLIQVMSGIQTQLSEKYRKNYSVSLKNITLLVPHILFPMQSVTLTASILMTVGVAHERYIAIKSPIKHRQSMKSTGARRNRLIKYILLVSICSFAINATKFMETKIVWRNVSMLDLNETEINRYHLINHCI